MAVAGVYVNRLSVFLPVGLVFKRLTKKMQEEEHD